MENKVPSKIKLLGRVRKCVGERGIMRESERVRKFVREKGR